MNYILFRLLLYLYLKLECRILLVMEYLHLCLYFSIGCEHFVFHSQQGWTCFRVEQLEARLLSLDSRCVSWLNEAARREEKLCRELLACRLNDDINQVRSLQSLVERCCCSFSENNCLYIHTCCIISCSSLLHVKVIQDRSGRLRH